MNRGKVAYFIGKPWNVDDLTHILKESVEMFEAKLVQRQLLDDQLDGLHERCQSDQMCGLRLLAASMSHNLSNALAPIKCFLDALPSKLGEFDLDPKRMNDPAFSVTLHEDAKSNTQIVSQLGRALHEAAKVEPFVCEDRICLRAIAEEAVDGLTDQLEASLIRVHNEVPAGLPELPANEQQLRRFLTLFLDCALAELPSGSKLVWTAEEQLSRKNGASILLKLTDDGGALCDRHLGLPFVLLTVKMGHPTLRSSNSSAT